MEDTHGLPVCPNECLVGKLVAAAAPNSSVARDASSKSRITVGFIKNETLVFVNFSAQGASILKISVPIIKRNPDDSKTPPTCKVLIILCQVIALPKKQCFETIEDLLVY